MILNINTEHPLSELDVRLLTELLRDHGWPTPVVAAPEPEPEPKKTPRKARKAAPKAVPTEEPVSAPTPDSAPSAEPAEETDPADLSEAVEAATQRVSSGGIAQVKAALAVFGAERVSELKVSNVAGFLAELEKTDA